VEPFNYIKAKSLQEACAVLEEKGEAARAFAGGTDLLVQVRKGKIKLEWLVDLKGFGLDAIHAYKDGSVGIGALTTLNSIMDNEVIQKNFLFLSETVEKIASVQIRNRATIGGNLCNASPSADLAAPLLALGADAVITGSRGMRKIDLEELFIGPGKTSLHAGEILTEIRIPPLAAPNGAVYLKQTRSAMDLALAGVAVVLFVNADGTCRTGRIALSAVRPTPFVAQKASAALSKMRCDGSSLDKIAELAVQETKPIDDVRASSGYRLSLVKTLTADAIEEAFRRVDQSMNKKGR